MAQELEDGEFWLPSDFLTDDDLVTDFRTDSLKTNGSYGLPHGFGGSSGFNSDLSSPVSSVMGSTETESDEDDVVAGLTRKIAKATFQDSNLFPDYKPNEWKLSISPQSTLRARKQGSVPSFVTMASSPPEAVDVEWDLLCTAAEDVARMRMIEETSPFHSTKLLATPPKPCHVAVPSKITSQTTGLYSSQAQSRAQLAYLRLQATRLQQMKEQQMMRRGVWGHAKTEHQFQNGKMTGEACRTHGLSMAAWPTLQQSRQQHQPQPGSGMRAVFLRETGAKKERTGTGVFLPQISGANPAESRKKTGYSTVLLPDRVVQALNLNIDSIDAQPQRRGNTNSTPEYGGAGFSLNNVMIPQRPPVMNKELGFSRDLTY